MSENTVKMDSYTAFGLTCYAVKDRNLKRLLSLKGSRLIESRFKVNGRTVVIKPINENER